MMEYYWHHGEDRLSALPDRALVCVLSHLPSVEATRSSALSSRWRRLFRAVPVVDLVDSKIAHRRWSLGSDRPTCFDQKVTSAILSRAPGTPIRALRLLVLDAPRNLLDQWVVIAATSGVEEVDVALQYSQYLYFNRKLCPFRASDKASADFPPEARDGYIKTPRQLFRCPTLRRLRLTNWTLDLPWGFGFTFASPSLETICLKRIMAPNGAIQQLLYACPRLAHLTLEECPGATELVVPSYHLRSFAMVCCHNAWRVALLAGRLRSLRYKGGLPSHAWFFYIANYDEVKAVTVDICEDLTPKSPPEVAHLTSFISRCKKLTYLHLALLPSMAYYCSAVAYQLPHLRQLVLKGFLATDYALRSVVALLVNAYNLEELSLFPQGRGPPKDTCYDSGDYDNADVEPENCLVADEAIDYDWMNKNLRWMYVPCFHYSLRRVTIANYSGNAFDRILAQFVLNKAAALEEFSVTLLPQLSQYRNDIAMEFRSWLYNPAAIVTCN